MTTSPPRFLGLMLTFVHVYLHPGQTHQYIPLPARVYTRACSIHTVAGSCRLLYRVWKEIAFPNRSPSAHKAPNEQGALTTVCHGVLLSRRAMEALVAEGLVRHLGVANFGLVQLEGLLAGGITVKPVCNQVWQTCEEWKVKGGSLHGQNLCTAQWWHLQFIAVAGIACAHACSCACFALAAQMGSWSDRQQRFTGV